MMEVYKCLDDIITKIERQEQIILKARLHLGSLAISININIIHGWMEQKCLKCYLV